jgi:hypothetical protein
MIHVHAQPPAWKALTVKPSFSDRNATAESGSMLVGTVRCSIVKQLSTTIKKILFFDFSQGRQTDNMSIVSGLVSTTAQFDKEIIQTSQDIGSGGGWINRPQYSPGMEIRSRPIQCEFTTPLDRVYPQTATAHRAID